VKLSDADFIFLRDFIYSICGIYFHSGKKYFLESRLSRRMAEVSVPTPGEYFKLLKSFTYGKDELKKLLDEITTNETCFFRNMPQLTALEKQFLPELQAIKGKIGFRKLKIWSAGSSSGEEPYTLAMFLQEKSAALMKDWSIEIIGTDINETVLAQAREGLYSAYSVRNTPEIYLKKYFSPAPGGRYLLSPAIRKQVTFTNLNLYDDARMLFMKSFDFIFCANVLIYFDITSKSKVVQHFYNNLQSYGYLFIGQSESLHGINDLFKAVHFPGGFAYKK
jgi:chemotaxis protein methyltransferase CheR